MSLNSESSNKRSNGRKLAKKNKKIKARKIKKTKSEKRNKNKAKRKNMRKQAKSSCTLSDDCLMNVMDFMKTSKEKIKNYERQKKRIESQTKRVQNKNAKKDNFVDILKVLNDTVGVNGTGCVLPSTSFQNESAILLENLSSCSGAIESACVVDVDLTNETGNN